MLQSLLTFLPECLSGIHTQNKMENQTDKINEEINWNCPEHKEYTSGCSWCKQEAEDLAITPRGKNDMR